MYDIFNMFKNPFLKNKSSWFKKTSFQEVINNKEENKKVEEKPIKNDDEGIQLDLSEVKNASSLDLIFNDILANFIKNYNKEELKKILLEHNIETQYELKVKTIIDPSTIKITKDNYGIIQDNKKIFHVKGGVITLESISDARDKKMVIIYDYMTSPDDLDKKQYEKNTFLKTVFKNLSFFPVVYFATDIKENDLILFNWNCKLNVFYNKNIVVQDIPYQPASIFLQEWFDEKKLNFIFQKTLENAILNILK